MEVVMKCLIIWGSSTTRVVIFPGMSVLMICACIPDVREVTSLVPPKVGSFFEALPSIHCYLFCKWQLIWALYPDLLSLLFLHCTLIFAISFNLLFPYFGCGDFPRAWAVLCAVASRSGIFLRLTSMGYSRGGQKIQHWLICCVVWLLETYFSSSPLFWNLSFWHAVSWLRVKMGLGQNVCIAQHNRSSFSFQMILEYHY